MITAFKHKKQIFSGIQPTSIPHIGNYFGAVKQWVDMQDRIKMAAAASDKEEPLIISIVDLHAITTPREPKILKYPPDPSLCFALLTAQLLKSCRPVVAITSTNVRPL